MYSRTIGLISTQYMQFDTKHPGVREIQFNFIWRSTIFSESGEQDFQISKIYFCFFIIKLLEKIDWTTLPNSPNLEQTIFGIQDCLNEWTSPFSRGDNNDKVKIHWWNFKIFFFTTTRLILRMYNPVFCAHISFLLVNLGFTIPIKLYWN